MITSPSNARVKEIVRLCSSGAERSAAGVFIAEGPRMVLEAPPEDLVEVYASTSYLSRCEAPPVPFEEVTDEVYRKMSDTRSPQGILALVRQKRYELGDLLTGRPLLILEHVQDPGNLGTMLRTGEGAGIGGVLADRETVDRYNPKVVRSTMGSLYRVPFVVTEDLKAAIRDLKAADYRVFAAHLRGNVSYDEIRYSGRSAFLIGNEGNGLTDETAALADMYIRIPMEGKVESLNAAVSAAILLYECYRQIR